jgi:hypothetical protein
MARSVAAKKGTLETAAGLVDRLYNARQDRLAKQKEVDELRKVETELHDAFIQALSDAGASEVSGKDGHGKLVLKMKAKVVNWDLFYKFIAKDKAWEFLQRRVNDAVVKERWDAGKKVPGVEQEVFTDLSLGKA